MFSEEYHSLIADGVRHKYGRIYLHVIDMGHIGHGHILSYFDNTMKITFVWANFTRMYITEILADLARLISLIIISGFMTVTMTAAVLT